MKLSNFLKNKKIANGLPSLAYIDEEFWKKECETIFKDNWVFVGYKHELNNLGDTIAEKSEEYFKYALEKAEERDALKDTAERNKEIEEASKGNIGDMIKTEIEKKEDE